MPQRKWAPALTAAAAALGACLPGPVHAMDWRPDAIAMQGGVGKHAASVVAAGVVWEWDLHKQRRAVISGQTELILSHWKAHAVGGGNQGLQQVALVPVLRFGLDRGRSPWYLELGVGASWLSRDYVTPDKTFSSRWNFYDVLGGGYRFGAGAQHEIGLRYVHVSNAGLRKPNPGEEFLLLRYAFRF